MIGLGTWECRIDTLFFKGTVKLKVFDDNGSYGFDVIIPDFKVPDITVKEIEEDGNEITATVCTSILPGKDITVYADIDGDTLNGFVKAPFVGKVKLKDCRRIEEA